MATFLLVAKLILSILLLVAAVGKLLAGFAQLTQVAYGFCCSWSPST